MLCCARCGVKRSCDFLPGERYILYDSACQENDRCDNGSQFCLQVASFFALETGQYPTQGFFAKVDARLNRPASNISPPNGFSSNISRTKIMFEHTIAGVKRCRMVKDVFRNTKDGFSDLVMEVACALLNLRVECRHPQPVFLLPQMAAEVYYQ